MAVKRRSQEGYVVGLREVCADISKRADELIGNIDMCGAIDITIKLSPDEPFGFKISKDYYTRMENVEWLK